MTPCAFYSSSTFDKIKIGEGKKGSGQAGRRRADIDIENSMLGFSFKGKEHAKIRHPFLSCKTLAANSGLFISLHEPQVCQYFL